MHAPVARQYAELHPERPVNLLRRYLGAALRRHREDQRRTLREVSTAARVSLGYLSEVERGQKEASSELIAAICTALGVRVADVLSEVAEGLAAFEPFPVAPPALESLRGGPDAVRPDRTPEPVELHASAARRPRRRAA